MELKTIRIESDKTWMKFADIMVEAGVFSDCIENYSSNKTAKEARKQ